MLDREGNPTTRRCPKCMGLVEYVPKPERTYADGIIALHSTTLRFEEVVELLPEKENT